jgi:DNA-binding NtrC family response regulator
VEALRLDLGADTPLVGSSPAIRRLTDAMGRIAPIPSPVLITGESGSGKEVVARAVHRLSGAKGPFLAINCAALPADLVESELFGHERGAFTGAVALRKGAFESAAGGTLFLDEIGELPLAAQAKLLRVLEQREVTRVGGTRTIKVDARVLAATNRDLAAEIAAGRFREDLLYRLNVHALAVPSLRERLSDVPELAKHLLAETCARFRMRPRTLSAAALECLMTHDWARNNVRELRNVLERMLIASDDPEIGLEDVPPEIREVGAARRVSAGAEPRTFHELKAEAERQIVIAALERLDWHITRTAEALGLADHASLLKIMRRHGISRE